VNGERLKSSEAEVTEWIKNYISSGNNEFWGHVFEKYKKTIFIQCLKILGNEEDAKDLTSDVFIKALENIHTYELDRPLMPWLCRIAKNLCIDHIRRKHRIQFMQTEDFENIKSDEDTTDNEDSNVLRQKIKRTIDGLKRPQRMCFCLFYLHQKSYDEIVRLTGYTYDEVRSHIQNGRRKFKLILER
jgi:RNA polymerase sigma factor (sigma-70 family)